MRALIVDDSRTARMILKKMLGGVALEVCEAANGQEALDALADNQFDIAFVDWNMPVMNGYEFVKSVRAEEQYANLPIMMLTTETEATQVVKALAAGANEYVMKPYDQEMILDKLKILGMA